MSKKNTPAKKAPTTSSQTSEVTKLIDDVAPVVPPAPPVDETSFMEEFNKQADNFETTAPIEAPTTSAPVPEVKAKPTAVPEVAILSGQKSATGAAIVNYRDTYTGKNCSDTAAVFREKLKHAQPNRFLILNNK